MPASKPDWVDDLAAARAFAWRMLGVATVDRRSAFHLPQVGTIGLDGRPRVRTVVLRSVDEERRVLRFNTDRRSDKFAELAADPRICLHFYDPAGKIQLRCEGVASLHVDDAVAEAGWTQAQRMSRVCYGTAPAPGSAIDTPDGFSLPSAPDEILAGRVHYAVVETRVDRLEWLYLAYTGHRRALFDETTGTANWLAP